MHRRIDGVREQGIKAALGRRCKVFGLLIASAKLRHFDAARERHDAVNFRFKNGQSVGRSGFSRGCNPP